jgi:hypothetical protein
MTPVGQGLDGPGQPRLNALGLSEPTKRHQTPMVLTKKQRERDILDEVYAHRNLFEVQPHESPDFLLRTHPNANRFGVEITEFYLTQSEARLERIEGYFQDLLDGGDVRHKDDHANFKVTKVSITSKEGDVRATDVPVILHEGYRLGDFVAGVAETIGKKDRVIDDAPEGLTHINLIVRDRHQMLRSRSYRDFHFLCCTPELQQAVFTSRFREVFLITSFEEGEAFIPLKTVMTMAKIYMAVGFLEASDHKDCIKTFNDFMRWFARYLSTIAAGEVRLREEGKDIEVLYGNSGFIITKSRTTIHDHADFALPDATLIVPDPSWDDFGARSGMPDYEKTQVFECGMVFAVRTGEALASEGGGPDS